MVLKAIIGSVAGIAALVGVLSVVPADLSKLNYIDRCITQQMVMPIPMGCGPYNMEPAEAEVSAKADEQKSYEEALILLFLGGSSRGAQWTSLQPPVDDIDRRIVALPADWITRTELAAKPKDHLDDKVEVAGLLKWILGIGIL